MTGDEREAVPLGVVVGENVQRIRKARDLTQDDAAMRVRAAGLMWSRSGIAALESGQREDITVSALLLVAAAFDVRPVDLVAGDGRVRLTDQATASRAWLRDYLVDGRTRESLARGASAARALTASIPGERVSFKADAELAQRLGLRAEQVYRPAEQLWGRNLHQERERRLAELGDMTAGQRRVRRGHITRRLADELAPHLPNGAPNADDA